MTLLKNEAKIVFHACKITELKDIYQFSFQVTQTFTAFDE